MQIFTSDALGIMPENILFYLAQWMTGMTDAAVNQGRGHPFYAMLLIVICMFIAALFIRKTGKIV